MNNEAIRVKATLKEIEKVLKGDADSLMEAFVWDRTPQGSKHWVDIYCGNKKLTDSDREYLESLLKEEEKQMTSFVEKTPQIKEGYHLERKVWLEKQYAGSGVYLLVGKGVGYKDSYLFSKQELRQLIDGLTEVYEVLEESE